MSKGFEREEEFYELLRQARSDCPNFKASTLKAIITKTNPEFLEGLFEPRACSRKLRYIGPTWNKQVCLVDEDEFFKLGKIYKSIDFTGATYLIEGSEDRRIGSAYFEDCTSFKEIDD